jgi:hypothetical protein
MKATIDLDAALYRRLKVEAARRGRTVRELVAEGIKAVIDVPPVTEARRAPAAPDWIGSLSAYAAQAQRHDLASIRESIARTRARAAR